MQEIVVLTLREARRKGWEGNAERIYFDFYISGNRLFDLLGKGFDADAITPLGWGSIESQERAVAELLLRQEPLLPTRRCMLYVCPQCGDISCGAITVRVEQDQSFIVWKDFGYEHDWEENLHLGRFTSIGPFYFERDAYSQLLGSFHPLDAGEN